MSSYRGPDNFRVQMRPKGRGPFKHGADQMQSGRRFIQGMQLPIQQSTQYPPTVAYHTPTRSNQYSSINSSEYVTYPQQVAVPASTWPPIPITVSDSYQHSYQPQPPVYNPDSPHMIAVQNSGYMAPVQSQNDYDPLTTVCTCSKCGFLNSLALVQLKDATENLKVLREQLAEKERQLEELQQTNANYEDENNPRNSVHQSSLSVDAQPFQMAGAINSAMAGGTYQVTHVSAESAPNNPNGDTWTMYPTTPVVSASTATSDQYDNEPATDNNWDNSPQCSLPQALSEQTLPREEVEIPADCVENWDQGNQIMSSSGPFEVSVQDDNDTNHQEPKQTPMPPDDDGRISPKEVRDINDSSKNRPRDVLPRHNSRGRGNKNDRQDNRDNESRGNFNRRGSGTSTGYQYSTTSPHDQTDRQFPRGSTGSRDSSHSRAKSGSGATDKLETSSTEGGEKRVDSAERNTHEKRSDTGNRRHSQDKHFDPPRDRAFGKRGGGGGRRSEDCRFRGPEEDWRVSGNDSKRDRDDDTRNRKEGYPRSGTRGSDAVKKSSGNHSSKVVTETDGDLFKAPSDYSLAHCVAEDLRMGSGIAVAFRQTFKCVEELLDQNKRVGEVAVLPDHSRFIFYLITKHYSSGKPTWENFRSSIVELKNLCKKHDVKNLAMPRLGCGLDRLEWRDVKRLVEETFSDSGVSVTVYNYQQNEDENTKPKSSLYIVHEKRDLVDINPETGLLFLCSENSNTNRTFDSLDKKHRLMMDYQKAKKVVGEVITIQKGKEYLYGLVVKKAEKDPLSYVNLGKCLRKFRNINSKERYGYFGLEAFRDNKDPLTMEKIVTLFRNLFGGVQYKLDLYICWPEELQCDHSWDEPSTPTSSSK